MKKSIRGNYTSRAEQELLDLDENINKVQISRCYFESTDNRCQDENYHPEGICMYCDWHHQMKNLRWDHSNFIEFWDYPSLWYKFHRVKNSLITFEDIEHYMHY